jgi:excinuclease ABC subunit C
MDLKSLPHSPGVYLMRDEAGRILYVGKARDIAKRVASYFLGKDRASVKTDVLVSSIHHIDYIPTASERDALLVEQGLIKKLQPHYNIVWKDDKSYPYVKIAWNEPCPQIYLTRRRLRDGAHYFGPYPNVRQIRHLLRYLWHKPIFAVRPGHHTDKSQNSLSPQEVEQCRLIAREVELFFRGRYQPLMKQWRKEMEEASRRQDYETAAKMRDNLMALERMRERVTVRRIDPSEVESHVDRSRAANELQKALALPRPPVRIECFDISHIQGLETVASLVTFESGTPRKDGYRKFKIKTVQGIDDFASMGEVVGRRYRRQLMEGQPLPDLILIDGGKGQLSAACEALRLVMGPGYRKLSIAALAKREEELFLPDREQSILLPKDSPALHLVQHVRNEAHRFAVTFHRLRRAKRFLTNR